MVSTPLAPPTGSAAAPPPAPTPIVQRTRELAFGAALLLAALCLAWELWWAPTGARTLALKAVPVLLALPGLWRMKLYTYRWLSLAVWLYVTEGLVRATSEPGLAASLAWAEVALALLLFTGCAVHVRARLAAGRRAAADDVP